jgi:hypothetical protein
LNNKVLKTEKGGVLMKIYRDLRLLVFGISTLFLFSMVFVSWADELPKPLKGTVVSVDAQTKTIKLKTKAGEESILVRGHEVEYKDERMEFKRIEFTELKPGDQVSLEYYTIDGKKGTAGTVKLKKRAGAEGKKK